MSDVDNSTSRPTLPKPIDAEARELIAEQLLRGRSKESVLASLVELGHDPWMARGAIIRMEEEPAFKAARRLDQERLKLESVVSNLQRLWELSPNYGSVEKRTTPSRDEFIERYVIGCRPVVLTDVTRDWPAMTRWSPDDLKQRFGQVEVEIQDGRNANPKYEEARELHRHAVNMSEFVDRVVSGGATNDYYMTANNGTLRRPEFLPLLDDIGTLPPVCRRDLLPRLSNFWFGPAGTVSPLHHDRMMLFHTQVVGRKRWRLISPLETPRVYNRNRVYSLVDIDAPDLNRFPKFGLINTVLDVVVEPGETIFLPLAWWHQVSSLDVSLSVGYWNIDVPNQYEYHDPGVYNFDD
jgi:hypothetical protein